MEIMIDSKIRLIQAPWHCFRTVNIPHQFVEVEKMLHFDAAFTKE